MGKDAGMDGLDALMAELASKPQVAFKNDILLQISNKSSLCFRLVFILQTSKEVKTANIPRSSQSARESNTKSPKAIDGFTVDGQVNISISILIPKQWSFSSPSH